jgi:hypothetical protein
MCLATLSACASGPHPAVQMAAKDFDCPMKDLKRHEIYPNKQRVEGCGKEAIYIKGCTDYGVDGECGWAKQVPKP